MSKIKLLEIIPSLNKIGGAEVFFTNFAKDIIRNHNDVTLKIVVLYSDENSYLIKDLKKENVDIVFLDKHRGIDLKCAKKLRQILNEFKPDVIHTHLDSLVTLFLSLHFRKKYKIYHTVHNIIDKNFKKENVVSFLIKRRFIVPIAVSAQTALSIKKHTSHDCIYVNNGIDVNKFSSNIPYNSREIAFICVASFTQVKNQEFLINCFKNINFNCSLVFLGTGPNLDKCKILAKKVDKCNIRFLGHVENVNDFLANSKCLILPSISEGNPLVLNEAIASGCYVISSNVGGVKDVIKNKNFGILCAPNNEEEFVDAINFVYKNNQEILSYLENRNSSTLQTTKTMVNEYLSIFKGEKNV